MAAVAEAFEGVRAKLVRAVKQQESNGVAHAVRLGDVLTEGERTDWSGTFLSRLLFAQVLLQTPPQLGSPLLHNAT